MGAISFSLDPRLVAALQSALPLSVLIETGTFKGDTVSALESCFDKVVSIELSEVLYADAVRRFTDFSHIQILQGNSDYKLRGLRSEFQDLGVLYWLDAHWCAAVNAAAETSQCPLLNELEAIGSLNDRSVILIDDARLFLAPPLPPHEISQWPNFQEIVRGLQALSCQHELMVVNDVIAFFPKAARKAIEAYAQSYGADWLEAANVLSANLLDSLLEKEAVIIELSKAIRAYQISTSQSALEAKEAVIAKQARALSCYRAWIAGIGILFYPLAITRRLKTIFKPRLGNLCQYNPRPLTSIVSVKLENKSSIPKISIVTPSFQQGHFIARTIDSVMDQNYPNLQYFVQDGGSQDGTVDVLKKYANKLSGWSSEKDSGQSQAINLGFSHADGEIMAWLNSDDLLLPGALHTVANYFIRNPGIDVVYGNRLLIDEKDMEIGRWILPGHDSDVLSWVDYIPQETLFWRRRIWEKVGAKIDESFRFAMDWDLLVRFRDAGAKFGHIPQFMGAFRIHEHQKTSAAINEIGHQEMDRIRERILGRAPSRKEIREAVRPYLVKHIAVDMGYRVKKRLGWKV